MTTALIILGVGLNAALLVRCTTTAWRLNARMPELWQLLENKGADDYRPPMQPLL